VTLDPGTVRSSRSTAAPDRPTIVIENGVALRWPGWSAGTFSAAVSGAGSAISVLGKVSGLGGAGTSSADGAGGAVTLTAADGASRSVTSRLRRLGHRLVTVAEGATTARGVKGGNGGSVTVTASATGGTPWAAATFAKAGTSSLGGTGEGSDLVADRRTTANDAVGGSVRHVALDVAAAGADARIQAGTIAVDSAACSAAR
jgi:hypothetical protein